jgi:hypothetical protein
LKEAQRLFEYPSGVVPSSSFSFSSSNLLAETQDQNEDENEDEEEYPTRHFTLGVRFPARPGRLPPVKSAP